jgi:tetratricopeptide (TPR) repeat protein
MDARRALRVWGLRCPPWASRVAVASFLLASALPAVAQAPCTPPFARIVSAQGTVDVRKAGAEWKQADLNTTLCTGDAVRVGARSRAALMLTDETVLRLDQGTTLILSEPPQAGRSVLDQISGGLRVMTRTQRPLVIRTPFVNANVEGTEFGVRVGQGSATIDLVEGHVVAENEWGTVRLDGDGQVVAQPREAPHKDVVVRSVASVAWTLHVPTLLDASSLVQAPPEAAMASPAWRRSIEAYLAGDLTRALVEIGEPGDSASAELLSYRAALLLLVGRFDEAAPEIDRALRRKPDSVEAYALKTVVALSQNDRAAALEWSSKAVSGGAGTPVAWIARSYALQATDDIDGSLASAREAVRLDPRIGLAWARVAEMEMSDGHLAEAEAAARTAAAQSPDVARAQTILGFAYLTRMDAESARAAFERAIPLDQSDPLPRLGLGIARIRKGELAEGRAEIEVAVILDPERSLLRSYLGKAYFEERRDGLAAQQFALAEQRDPNDPTPYLYDALRKQSANRPVDALLDLEKSIELNGNRAVYRSRLLLDEDAAARSVSLARIYEDLGFERMSIVEAVRSLSLDPTNHSAHYFLSDYYLTQPRHEMARDSELLQAQLLQPLNANPAQPRLAGNGLGFLDHSDFRLGANEYSQLMTREGLRGFVDLAGGEHGTWLSSLAASGLSSTFSWSIGQSTYATDGFRPNNDQRLSVTNAFLQHAPSPDTSVQLELRSLTKRLGDTAETFFDEDNTDATVRDTFRSDSARLGFRYTWKPGTVLLASYIYRDETDHLEVPSASYDSKVTDRVHLLEVRGIQQGNGQSTTEGIRVLHGRETNSDPTVPETSIRHQTAYVYHTHNLAAALDLTLGASVDSYRDPMVDRHQFNPKLGVLWNPQPATTIRVAAFRALKPSVAAGQIVEPTDLVGFNQYFSGINDINGTDTKRAGIAIDHKISSALGVGTDYSQRRVHFFAAQVFAAEDVVFRESEWSSYLYWTPSRNSAVSLGFDGEWLSQASDTLTPNLLHDARTTTTWAEWRFFLPNGFFSKVRFAHLRQDGRFYDFVASAYVDGSSRGNLLDLGIGYRLPRRRGILTFEVRNALDEQFRFQEINPQNPTFPRRRVAAIRFRTDL